MKSVCVGFWGLVGPTENRHVAQKRIETLDCGGQSMIRVCRLRRIQRPHKVCSLC